MENQESIPENETSVEESAHQPQPEPEVEVLGELDAESFPAPEPESPVHEQQIPPKTEEVGTKPSVLDRFSHWLLDKDTSRGRFIRSAGRWTLVVLIAFAIGLAVFYFWQFRPLQARLADTQSQLDASRAEVTALSGDLDDLREENKDLAATNQNLEADLQTATARIYIAQIQAKALNARLQLNIRQGAAAQKSLREAKDLLAELKKVMGEDNQQVMDQLETRLAAATSALLTDPTVAIQDLETLDALLAQQDKLLSK